jgi:lysophospholipase L1-like esterase
MRESGMVFDKLVLTTDAAYVPTAAGPPESPVSGNLSPVADAGQDQTVYEGNLVILDGSGSRDLNGTIVSYVWEQTTGPGVTLSGSGAQRSFTAPAVGSTAVALTFRLTVTDDDGATGADTVTVTLQPAGTLNFADDFLTDSRSQYTVVNTWTQGGVGQFLHDSVGQRLQVKMGDDIGLQFGRLLPAATSTGVFTLDFLPTIKYPNGGVFVLRLEQDANNYYEIENTDGYSPGSVRKIVNGQMQEEAGFGSGYIQNVSYALSVTFTPGLLWVEGFGGAVLLNKNSTPLMVNRFVVELRQQDGYFDNLFFSSDISGIDVPVNYEDHFTTNTTADYVVTNTMTSGGVGIFSHDPITQRAQITTSAAVGIKISKSLAPMDTGIFETVLMPTFTHGSEGVIYLRVLYDSSNYYEIKQSNASSAGYVIKVVNGNEVERKVLQRGYILGKHHHMLINVKDTHTIMLLSGERFQFNSSSGQISPAAFEIEFNQVDSFIDDIRFTSMPFDYYVAVGDSITFGSQDDILSDGVGYQPILQTMLSETKEYDHVVYNEGVSGDTSLDGVALMPTLLIRHPNARFFLIQYGTNDAAASRPSGLALKPGDSGYTGSYKDYMQQIITMVKNAGKIPYLSKLPIASGAYSYLNTNIALYNQVIDELVVANTIDVVPPDLYCYFQSFPQDLSDGLHPDGSGYQAIADLWQDSLVDQSQPCN